MGGLSEYMLVVLFVGLCLAGCMVGWLVARLATGIKRPLHMRGDAYRAKGVNASLFVAYTVRSKTDTGCAKLENAWAVVLWKNYRGYIMPDDALRIERDIAARMQADDPTVEAIAITNMHRI